jgi:hypothetical protein
MTLGYAAFGALAVALTSCASQPYELQLTPSGTPAISRAGAVAYVERAAARYHMEPVSQRNLACERTWRLEGKPRRRVFRAPVLLVCVDYRETGPIFVRLLYDDWADSSTVAARVRRELEDSLARYGTLTAQDSLSAPILRAP